MSGSEFRGLSLGTLEDTSGQPNATYVVVFDVLYILGPVSLLVILLTAWRSPNVRRPSTWFMAVGSWVVIGIANILLIGHQMGPKPPHGICLAQAMMIYASPVLQLDFKFYIIPSTIAFSVAIEVLTLGLLEPKKVNRDASGLYCNFSDSSPRKTTGGSIMCGLLIVLLLEVLIILKYRRASRESTQLLDSEFCKGRTNISGDHIARILGFTACAIISFLVSVIQYLPDNFGVDNGKVSLVQASLPCCAGLIFGTQRPSKHRKCDLADSLTFPLES
ncbi:hypothetical protein BDN70DRAFT_896125 [Pholiota conissans]|uniref:Uncharacterized protein n=1 Tax=Pholiota conissans TaxID=109636 RepID=A0A9P6CS80_9AGAR|nr:hypothetical protein BDN70DRAFT_896125 [Pholiota conissans]